MKFVAENFKVIYFEVVLAEVLAHILEHFLGVLGSSILGYAWFDLFNFMHFLLLRVFDVFCFIVVIVFLF